jgi:mannose-1-phosphate guanylyltransferase
MRHAMIMAGGAGTRLWPMSTRRRPKQLVPFISGRSLLEIAAERLEGIVPAERRLICTSEAHREVIRESLPSFGDEQILGEPTGRDTLNAIGLTCAALVKRDPQATLAVFTADHLIEPEGVFRRCVETGFALVEEDPSRLVTFSIEPTFPATQFGYIERGEEIATPGAGAPAFHVKRYVEKPDRARAKSYLERGGFGWNSGMFVWRAQTMLEAIEAFAPEAHEGLMEIGKAWGTIRQAEALERIYPTLPKISVDYAIMEPASRDDRFDVCTVATEVRWRDVGSWPQYAETLEADERGNRSSTAGDTPPALVDCDNVTVVSDDPGRQVAVLGARNLIIVQTGDATLVVPAEQADRLKELQEALPERLK